MAYQQNIPQPTDEPSSSQNDLLQNFQAINALVNVNHEPFNGADQGKHTKVDLARSGAAPAPSGTFGVLYGLLSGSETELFYKNDAGTEQQLTNKTVSSSGTNYAFDLPSGIKLRFGKVNTSGVNTNVTFNGAFTTSVFSVVISAEAGAWVSAKSLFYAHKNASTSGFTIELSQAEAVTVDYIAIGV